MKRPKSQGAARQAVKDGASEIDMVINIPDAKNGDYEQITAEIAAMKKAVGKKILKVIVEACYLTDEENSHVPGGHRSRRRFHQDTSRLWHRWSNVR